MKRLLLAISVAALLTVSTSAASAAVLQPLAPEDAWHSQPIFATAPPDDSRLFVVERGDPVTHNASIRVVEDGVLKPEPFLTVPNVDVFNERGLLSMAFSPDYATSGLFYVFWIAKGPDALNPFGNEGDIRVVEFRRSAADPDVADPISARLVFDTPHDAPNHDGGWMAFGPDGYLYFTIGDNATKANAQSLANLYGKVLRINPQGNGPGEYSIPPDQPFPTIGQNRAIFAIGLRNPYRASFAPGGDLVVADVGELTREEVNVGDFAGKNFGWPLCEGSCEEPGLTNPFFSYGHQYDNPDPEPGTGNVIIGGYVVRDPDLAGLTGRYLYGDNARTDLRTLNLSVPGGDPVDPGLSVDNQYSLLSFGEDSRGCTYVMADGTVYRVAADSSATADCPHEAKPGLAISSKGQRLGKRIAFAATCDEKCTITGKGAVKAKRRGKKKAVGFRYSTVSRSAAADRQVKVVLRLKTRALKNARKVLRSGHKLSAVLVATAADPSGNKRTVKFTIKIRRTAPPR